MEGNGKGIQRPSFPPPWEEVAMGIHKFLTYEGIHIMVFVYNFKLMIHLRHSKLINLPYFLLKTLEVTNRTTKVGNNLKIVSMAMN